ncbi:MAG: extracellular solute-binding protein [Oscillospiraceae bacterium]
MQEKMRYISAGLLAAMLVSLSGCAPKSTAVDDVLTQKVTEQGRTPITVLVKNAFSVDGFEVAVEKKFPNIDIIQVGNHTSNMGIAEYETRMKHDDLTDLVMTWPLDAGSDYAPDRLLDLSALPCTARYNAAHLDKVSEDGKLYYLPGPAQIRGIVYNKTLFRENGWAVPKDFEGFLSLCDKIDQTGIRALQLGLGNAEVLDTAFVGYSLSECMSSPADFQWLNDYNSGEGSFAAHAAPALDIFQTLIDRKVLQPGDLKLTYADRETMVFSRQCAMVEDSVLIARMGMEHSGCTDEFGLMPFFNPGKNGDWARLYPVCYIGANRHLEEPQNKAKYELVLQLLDYISTPEGQQALMGDTGAMYSSLLGVPPPDVPEIVDLLPALESGRCTVFPTLKNAQSALRKGLAGMVAGTLTADQVAEMVEAQNKTPEVSASLLVLGSAAEDFTQIETGNFVTDAMRAKSGCEIALFLDNGKDGKTNGKGIGAKLYEGPLTVSDIFRILPDLRDNETMTLCEVTMTGENLIHTLEYAIPVDNHRTGWFYYFSGLQMEFSPTAQPGSRIKSITDADGNAIDPAKLYSVAVMDHSVPEDALETAEDTGIYIPDLLEEVITQNTISPSDDNRFTVVGPEQ